MKYVVYAEMPRDVGHMDILTGAKIAELQTDKNFALLFVIQ
jgi:hypothetical protein